MAVTLYYAPGTCATIPYILLKENGIDYKAVKVDLRTKKTEHGDDYLKINPRGAVPALVLEDNTVITQNIAITTYIGYLTNKPHLAPKAGSVEQAKLLEALCFASDFHTALGPYFAGPKDQAVLDTLKVNSDRRIREANEFVPEKGFLGGSEPNQSDYYIAVVASWIGYLGLDASAAPRLIEFQKRIFDRPAVKEVLKEQAA